MPTDALAAIADELYTLLPDAFTAARNDSARSAKSHDRELAGRILELRRPAPAAWLVNQLVRHRPEAVADVLALGAAMRAAQRDLDAAELGRLGRERRRVVAALTREADTLAVDLGNPVRQPVLDELALTLQAAMTDASAGDALSTGRLVRGLETVGLEVDLEGAVAGGAALSGTHPAVATSGSAADGSGALDADARHAQEDSHAQKLRERVEREAHDAEHRATEAETALARLDDRTTTLRTLIDVHSAARTELEERLRVVEAELAEAERELRPLLRERDRAARGAEYARAAADEARDALG